MNISKTHYGSNLLTVNSIDSNGFCRWVFYPGMLFHSDDKWWGDWGNRKKPHEGLDICFYQGTDGEIRYLTARARIPVIFDGKVVRILDDYIGKTIFVLHDIFDVNQNQLCSIYGHTVPSDIIEVSSTVREADVIATVSDAERRGVSMSSHLHLSLAWIPKTYEHQQLNWEKLSSKSHFVLLDPLTFISSNHIILPASPL